MAKTAYTASVTFESENGPPDTVRVTFEAANPRQAARRAVEQAMRQMPGRRWSSLVILLERVEP